ncbi:MAG: thioesterase [Alphaproteobacteria bacterium]|nr:thioesterase [Alphaproteobacteria bacterium]
MIDPWLGDYRDHVRPEWIDYNGHMNVAYYVLAFDRATDVLFDRLGLGHAHRQAANHGFFVVEAHVTYGREVLEGDPLRFRSWLVEVGERKLRYFLEMVHAEKGYLAATIEFLGLNIDLGSRRSAPFPAALRQRLQAAVANDVSRGLPAEVGRSVGQPRVARVERS